MCKKRQHFPIAIKLYILGTVKYGKGREGNLPREGYRTIVVTDEVYSYVQKRAAEPNQTIPNTSDN
jgi:hypothetical protein